MNNELNKIDINLTKKQLENTKKITEEFEKIIEKHLGKNFSFEYKAILIISYAFSKGNKNDFEKQVIILKKLLEENKK